MSKKQVSVRGSVYDAIRERARAGGEHISTLVDGILVKWLDEQNLTPINNPSTPSLNQSAENTRK
jgi:hypothetical protein